MRHRYARSVIGPFWITLSMVLLILTISSVWSLIFKIHLREYLPYLTVGMVYWGLFHTSITEASGIFPVNVGYIKQVRNSYFIFIFQLIYRNFLIFTHNVVVVLFVLVVLSPPTVEGLFLALLGLALFLLNTVWLGAFVGLLGCRYRDLQPIIASVLQVFFYVTPIMYMETSIRSGYSLFFDLNPMYHMLSVVRAPLLLGTLPIGSAIFLLITAVVGFTVTFYLYGKYSSRIAYWA